MTSKRCPICGGFISDELWTGIPKPKQKCPGCGSMKNWKNGIYHAPTGARQRYYCRDCGLRFSER